jgi:hypothetical protein
MNSRRVFLAATLATFMTAWAIGQNAPEIPAGATVRVRVIENLNSEDANIGDTFHGTLEDPIFAGDHEIYPKDADVDGRIVDVHKSGRLTEPGELDLVLTTVRSGNRTSSLHVQPLVIKGESHAKSNTSKIGGGAVLGAIIGAIAGGGKGAAVGATAGAAAGTGAAAVTGAREAKVPSETVLSFVTVSPDDLATASNTATPAAAPGDLNSFSLRDRRVLNACLSEHASELPPGTMQKSELSPGAERDLHRDGTVPPEVAKQMQPLPLACMRQLPNLPSDQERVVYAGRVLLITADNHILDIFELE